MATTYPPSTNSLSYAPAAMHKSLAEIIIHDNVATDEVIPYPGLMWWQWGFIIVGIIFLISIALLLLKAKKQGPPRIPCPLDHFNANIRDLSQKQLGPTEFGVESSLTLRSYLQQKSASPALYQTNEEINADSLQQLGLPSEIRLDLIDFINSLETLKYNSPTASTNFAPEIILKHMVELVYRIHAVPPRTEEDRVAPPALPSSGPAQ